MGDASQRRARREQILGAAEELLQHYGYAKTTVADIARQAAVGVGSVYLEFRSKDEIVAALAEQRHCAVLEAMRRAAAGEGPFADRLVALIEERVAHFVRYLQQGQHGRDMITCGCAAVGRVHAQYREDEVALVTELLSRAHEAAEFSVPDAPRAARILLLLVDQLVEHMGCAGDEGERSRLVRLGAQILLDGLRSRKR